MDIKAHAIARTGEYKVICMSTGELEAGYHQGRCLGSRADIKIFPLKGKGELAPEAKPSLIDSGTKLVLARIDIAYLVLRSIRSEGKIVGSDVQDRDQVLAFDRLFNTRGQKVKTGFVPAPIDAPKLCSSSTAGASIGAVTNPCGIAAWFVRCGFDNYWYFGTDCTGTLRQDLNLAKIVAVSKGKLVVNQFAVIKTFARLKGSEFVHKILMQN